MVAPNDESDPKLAGAAAASAASLGLLDTCIVIVASIGLLTFLLWMAGEIIGQRLFATIPEWSRSLIAAPWQLVAGSAGGAVALFAFRRGMQKRPAPPYFRLILLSTAGFGVALGVVTVALTAVPGRRDPTITGPSTIRIGSAIYGTSDQSKRCDASAHVRQLCDGTTGCRVYPTNAMCGDPRKGTPKQLFVTYRCGDVGMPLLTLPEGRESNIACQR
jgi:hypothetical protein